MIKRVKQLKDPRSCSFGIGGLFLWGDRSKGWILNIIPSPFDGGGKGWPPAQAPPQLPARRVLQLGERGFCPGGRASGSERGDRIVPLPSSPPTKGGETFVKEIDEI